ncbi:ABC transporter ATP-binding protein [Natronorubrum texcoconense]|uniref:ABC-2 type transport system ATP-binding protein n=1 Tax=Natronorubrum texcoconense TaxID=1095776 RepID=A0A1G8WR58_9EURY|nr:ABC transporter ATP-binding protein [Natronorubrum texcoconense]SDJ80849.1 ABC-2 type transport system ATP-binding protein [Natronorubrum texcoconense]
MNELFDRDAGGDREQSAGDQSKPSDDQADTPAVAIEGVSKTFENGTDVVTAVDDVSFTVDSGSVVGILGPNGAGKTTLIKSILGLIYPDSGSVRINGHDISENPTAVYEDIDAMMEGARNDYWRLTVDENLRFFASVGGEHPDAIEQEHERLLRKLDLLDKRDEQVRNLSRGMKQKVALASALARDISVVFLDEPTLGLDIESSLTLRRQLRQLVDERELTVLLTSHDMDTIQSICDRVIILNDGAIVTDDTVQNLLDMFQTQEYRFSVRSLSEALAADLRERFTVTELTRYEDRTRFVVAADTSTFFELTAYLEGTDIQLLSVETRNADLEEIFMEIVE